MKKLIVILILFGSFAIKAQAPQYLNYQGVARNSSGTIITAGNIGIQFEILQGSASGPLIYSEENFSAPSTAGIFTTAIGSGSNTIGTFSSINWAGGPYFIRVSIDPTGGTSFSAVGTSQLLSVPYALYAETAGNIPNFTAGNAISITSGSIINTAPDQPVNINQAGVANVLGAYPNYTIDVGSPALNYNSGTQVLTLSQGTLVSTATISITSGSVNITGAGIATVTPSGPGTSFTVAVANPTLTGAGSTTVSGTYPYFVISTPGPTLTPPPTNIQVNPPHATTTLSPGNYSITVQPTSIIGPGVIGSYPNYTVTSAPSTSIAPGGGNVIINGSAPSYTIVATTPSLQINPPHTTTTLSLNSYSINVAPTNLAGTGVASVSGTYPNYSVSVPAASLSASGNTLTVTQGTATSTATISAGPWTVTSGVLHPAANPTNDKVAIGQTTAASNLDVANVAVSNNTINPVVSVTNYNAAFTGSGVLSVKHQGGNGAAIFVDNSGNGDGISVNTNNASNGGNAVQVRHFGIGNAGYFEVANSTSGSKAIDASTNGTGGAISAVINNTLNASNSLYVSSNGTGSAGFFSKIGTGGYGVYSSHSGSSGTAGFFNISSSTNSSQALIAQTSGNNDALAAYNIGVGRAFFALGTSSVDAALITNSGTGRALYVSTSNTSDAGFFTNTSNGRALYASNTGNMEAAYFSNTGSARSLIANNTSTLETALFNNSGTGRGLVVQNPNTSSTRAVFIQGGIDIMGKSTSASSFAVVVSNSASINLFNIREDGHVGVGVSSPGYRLSVFEGTGTAAALFSSQNSAAISAGAHGIYGLTSNSSTLAAGVMGENSGVGPAVFGNKMASSGPAGRFEISLPASNSPAVFAKTSGLGAAVHAFAGPNAAGSTNLSLMLDDGHLSSFQATVPSGSVNITCTSCSAASTATYATDVAGSFSFSMSGSFAGTIDFTVNYIKPYRKTPIVVITPANLFATNANNYYVTNIGGPGNYTGFMITFVGGIAAGAGSPKFNYMVIEASN